jgi:glucose-6-phosphate 1-dehydrogenase
MLSAAKEAQKNMTIVPTVFVIFGGTGDLTWRKLAPSLFDLHQDGRMPKQFAIIAVGRRSFSDAVPHQSFPPEACRDWHPSRLILSIQPKEGIILCFQAKVPGRQMRLQPVEMRFNYRDSFAAASPDAYETLLWDVMNNDPMLFMRADQIEAAWKILMPVLERCGDESPRHCPNYAAGIWGPKAADELLAHDGRQWSPIA